MMHSTVDEDPNRGTSRYRTANIEHRRDRSLTPKLTDFDDSTRLNNGALDPSYEQILDQDIDRDRPTHPRGSSIISIPPNHIS